MSVLTSATSSADAAAALLLLADGRLPAGGHAHSSANPWGYSAPPES